MFTFYYADCLGREDNCLYPHKAEVTDTASLKQAVARDYVCAAYKNSYRSNANFISSNCLAVEFDNDHSDNPKDWITPKDLRDAFPDVTIGIHYSRHHMKKKNGKAARPKFHAFLEIDSIDDPDAYSAMKRRVACAFPYVDPKALDAARFFYGTDNPQVEYFPGTKKLNEVLEEDEFDKEMDQGSYGGSYIIKEGSRNATMSRFAGRIVKRYGWNDISREIFLEESKKCVPPLPSEELRKIWLSARKFEKVVTAQEGYVPPEKYNTAKLAGPAGCLMPEDYSDIGQAKVLSKEYGDEICFNPATDFFRYNGTYWEESKEAALGATIEFLDQQLADAELLMFIRKQAVLNSGAGEEVLAGGKKAMEGLTGEQRNVLMDYLSAVAYRGFVMGRRNIKYIRSAMEAAKPMVGVKLEELNADPLLLNTPQGSVRLVDGIEGMQEHDWKDYCTKVTAVEPGDKGKVRWEDALHKTFLGDQELIDYVQEVVGLSAIGKVYMEAMIIAYGEGRNGKSTFWNTIARVLGGYAGNVSADTLTVGCRRNVKPEMAELKGVRLALAKELEEGMRLNTSVVKQLTSTDDIYGEKKFCKPASFTPSHTLVLYTNHLPKVGATDEGTWRRLIVIPFNAVFEGRSDVKNYADYLYENAGPAILTWIIEGARRIIDKDFHLKNPKVVQDAIDEYRGQNDWLGDFLEECCEVDPSYREKSGELYQEYRAYCLRMGEYTRSTSDFYGALAQRDFERKRMASGVVVKGVRIKSEFGG